MTATGWRAGWAKTDITGEPWGVGLMGYGMPGQRGRGLLTRQWARAVVVATPAHRVAYVVADIGMFFQAAVDEITDRLAAATARIVPSPPSGQTTSTPACSASRA